MNSISMMNKASVNVPVLLWVWTRPDKIKKVFSVIKAAKPSILFLVSDGPRTSYQEDKNNIDLSRKVVEDIDWDCTVHRLYFDQNQGMYSIFRYTLDFVFKYVDRCIFLEDDVIPSLSFFKFMEELLEKYKNDMRINMICGMNHLGVYSNCPFDYLFTKGASIWGFAIWKRTYELFFDYTYGDNAYTLDLILENAKKYKKFTKSIKGYLSDKQYGGHAAGFEFFLGLANFAHSQLNIVATRNMVQNIGYGSDATHNNLELKQMPLRVQKFFNMEIHELDWPLKHPSHVVEDKNYERILYKIMGYSSCRRKLEGYWRAFWFGNKKEFFVRKIKKIFTFKYKPNEKKDSFYSSC